MERRESCPPIVWIGAGVDQRDRELEVTVLHREQQRARALADRLVQGGASGLALAALQRRVHIDARLQKRAHHVDVPLTHGKEERRESGIERRVDVGAGVDQCADDGGVSLGRCPHQGGLPAPLTRVVSGAARQERVHRLEISGSRRHHEDGLPALHRGVRIGAGGQQQLHDAAAPVRARHRQRRHAVAVHGVDVGARSHQQRRGLRIIVIRGPVQRGRSVDLGGVHVDAASRGGCGRAPCRVAPRRRRASRVRRPALRRRARAPGERVHSILRQCMCVSCK